MPRQCLGHYGFIDLHDFYVFNPLLYSVAKTLLSSVCLNCLHIGTTEKGRQKCMNCLFKLETLEIYNLSKPGKAFDTHIPVFIKCT